MRATFKDESSTHYRLKSLPAEGMPPQRVGTSAPPPRASEIRTKAKPADAKPAPRKVEVSGGFKEEMAADLRRDPRHEE